MQIENYREGPQKDNDKSLATFDVSYKGSRYLDLRLMRSQKGHHFIAHLSKMRVSPEGTNTFIRIYDWGQTRNQEFDRLVLDALKPFIKE